MQKLPCLRGSKLRIFFAKYLPWGNVRGVTKAMKASIFEFDTYRLYLKEFIESQPNGGRGFRTLLAHALQCQNSHITQVLDGDLELSLERADLFNQFVAHSPHESDYFILLVEHARSGTASLKKYFQTKIDLAKKAHGNLKNRLPVEDFLTLEQKYRYYSNWVYAAVHLLVGIPGFQNIPQIAQRLDLSEGSAQRIVDDLMQMGLLLGDSSALTPTARKFFLDRESPISLFNHVQWRLKTITALNSYKNEAQDLRRNFHFSSVLSLSESEFSALRDEIRTWVQGLLENRIGPSPEEKLVSFCLDFYEV